jgi:hypothetical protein
MMLRQVSAGLVGLAVVPATLPLTSALNPKSLTQRVFDKDKMDVHYKKHRENFVYKCHHKHILLKIHKVSLAQNFSFWHYYSNTNKKIPFNRNKEISYFSESKK